MCSIATNSLGTTPAKCSPQPTATVYVTVTATPSITDLGVQSSLQSAASVDVEVISNSIELEPINPLTTADTATDITTTRTVRLTYTEPVVITQVVQGASTVGPGKPYSLAEQDREIVLLNNTATSATEHISAGTSAIQVEPIPTASSQSTSNDETISLTLTSTVRITRTVVVQRTSSTLSFTGMGASGWNATGTNQPTAPINPTGTGVSVSAIQPNQTGIDSTVNPVLSTGYSPVYAAPSGYVKRHNGKRQVGSIVVATINGVVVSWTNVFDGAGLSTLFPAPQSSTVLPPSSGE